jgi:hypothetical protein
MWPRRFPTAPMRTGDRRPPEWAREVPSVRFVESHTNLDIFHRDSYVFCHKTV